VKKYRIIALALALVMMVALFAGCGQSGTQATQAPATDNAAVQNVSTSGGLVVSTAEGSSYARKTAAGTLTVGSTRPIVDTYDPILSNAVIGKALVYDTLFVRDPVTSEIEGSLVESWEWLDGTTLKMNLRKGVKFTNGEELTAEDVLFSFDRMINGTSQWSTNFDEIDIANSYAEDDYTVVFKYVSEYGPAMAYLCVTMAVIVNKDWAETATDDDWFNNPCGTGPYTLTENVSGSHATFTRKAAADFWGELPDAETITVKQYSEGTTMFVDYENGVLDMICTIDVVNAGRCLNKEVADTTFVLAPMYDVYSMVLSEMCPAFDDIRVREAIAHAVEWDQVCQIGSGALAKQATSIIPTGMDYYYNCGTYEYNPELSRQLLKEAGYENGLTIKLVTVDNPTKNAYSEAIQAYLAEVGITMTIESAALMTAVGMLRAGEADCTINNSSGSSSRDPDQQTDTTNKNSTNLTPRITDETFNSYLDTARYAIDPAVREEAYKNAQIWMHDNFRHLPIGEYLSTYAYRPYLQIDGTLEPDGANLRYVQLLDK